MAASALAYGMVLVARALAGQIVVQGYASLMASIYFIGGLVLAVQGIAGIYIGKMYNETRRRPLYVVADRVGIVPAEATR
jgi:dolichol-phosphate mannosyltransferase